MDSQPIETAPRDGSRVLVEWLVESGAAYRVDDKLYWRHNGGLVQLDPALAAERTGA